MSETDASEEELDSEELDEEDLEADIHSIALMRRFRLDQRSEKDLAELRSRDADFAIELQKFWGRSLDAYTRCVTYAKQLEKDLTPTIQAEFSSEKTHFVEVMIRLHPQACLVASEIGALLSAGYAQGAYARWQTLYEIGVISLFIEEHGEELALRFWMHGAIERQRLANEYALAGFSPLDSDITLEVTADRESAISRWGKDFSRPNGWAAAELNNPTPTFRHIEEAVHELPRDKRWHYQWASFGVHPNVWGLTVNIGLPSNLQGSLVGPSIFGLALPASASLVSLNQATTAFVSLCPDTEWWIRLQTLRYLIESAQAEFENAETIVKDNRGPQ